MIICLHHIFTKFSVKKWPLPEYKTLCEKNFSLNYEAGILEVKAGKSKE
jgi:hypothetical protein